MKLYGISNCDTVKKARAWLSLHGRQIEFHDFKKQGISAVLLTSWLRHLEWEALLNRRGTTWRKLPDATKASINNADTAIQLMLEQPSVIKRPVLEFNDAVYVGFDETLYHSLFGKSI